MPFSYSTSFTLDKAHFEECYTQSVSEKQSIRHYLKAIILSIVGLLMLMFTEQNPYVAWFIVALGILEALSIYYRKPWWITRQMLGKESNSEITLNLDESSITTTSFYVNIKILWEDVNQLEKTQLGWLVFHKGGKAYISSSCLSSETENFIQQKLQSL